MRKSSKKRCQVSIGLKKNSFTSTVCHIDDWDNDDNALSVFRWIFWLHQNDVESYDSTSYDWIFNLQPTKPNGHRLPVYFYQCKQNVWLLQWNPFSGVSFLLCVPCYGNKLNESKVRRPICVISIVYWVNYYWHFIRSSK